MTSRVVHLRGRAPYPFTTTASDGFPVCGYAWRHEGSGDARPVVIVGSATSVLCRYYFRFAEFLFRNGFDVLTFDYRGIGQSRPNSLRGFDASWLHWGQLDYEAIFQYAGRSFPNRPIDVVGHSIGGFIFGLAKSSGRIRRAVTVGAQYAYAPDYAPDARLKMIAKWHVTMPLITLLFGYFPGRRLGWLEDTPKGVVNDWVFSKKRFEDRPQLRQSSSISGIDVAVRQMAELKAPVLAISASDDEFGTVSAIERALSYYGSAKRTHVRISPAILGQEIGHFGFFHQRFERDLWQLPLAWLSLGKLPRTFPGQVVSVKT